MQPIFSYVLNKTSKPKRKRIYLTFWGLHFFTLILELYVQKGQKEKQINKVLDTHTYMCFFHDI